MIAYYFGSNAHPRILHSKLANDLEHNQLNPSLHAVEVTYPASVCRDNTESDYQDESRNKAYSCKHRRQREDTQRDGLSDHNF